MIVMAEPRPTVDQSLYELQQTNDKSQVQYQAAPDPKKGIDVSRYNLDRFRGWFSLLGDSRSLSSVLARRRLRGRGQTGVPNSENLQTNGETTNNYELQPRTDNKHHALTEPEDLKSAVSAEPYQLRVDSGDHGLVGAPADTRLGSLGLRNALLGSAERTATNGNSSLRIFISPQSTTLPGEFSSVLSSTAQQLSSETSAATPADNSPLARTPVVATESQSVIPNIHQAAEAVAEVPVVPVSPIAPVGFVEHVADPSLVAAFAVPAARHDEVDTIPPAATESQVPNSAPIAPVAPSLELVDTAPSTQPPAVAVAAAAHTDEAIATPFDDQPKTAAGTTSEQLAEIPAIDDVGTEPTRTSPTVNVPVVERPQQNPEFKEQIGQLLSDINAGNFGAALNGYRALFNGQAYVDTDSAQTQQNRLQLLVISEFATLAQDIALLPRPNGADQQAEASARRASITAYFEVMCAVTAADLNQQEITANLLNLQRCLETYTDIVACADDSTSENEVIKNIASLDSYLYSQISDALRMLHPMHRINFLTAPPRKRTQRQTAFAAEPFTDSQFQPAVAQISPEDSANFSADTSAGATTVTAGGDELAALTNRHEQTEAAPLPMEPLPENVAQTYDTSPLRGMEYRVPQIVHIEAAAQVSCIQENLGIESIKVIVTNAKFPDGSVENLLLKIPTAPYRNPQSGTNVNLSGISDLSVGDILLQIQAKILDKGDTHSIALPLVRVQCPDVIAAQVQEVVNNQPEATKASFQPTPNTYDATPIIDHYDDLPVSSKIFGSKTEIDFSRYISMIMQAYITHSKLGVSKRDVKESDFLFDERTGRVITTDWGILSVNEHVAPLFQQAGFAVRGDVTDPKIQVVANQDVTNLNKFLCMRVLAEFPSVHPEDIKDMGFAEVDQISQFIPGPLRWALIGSCLNTNYQRGSLTDMQLSADRGLWEILAFYRATSLENLLVLQESYATSLSGGTPSHDAVALRDQLAVSYPHLDLSTSQRVPGFDGSQTFLNVRLTNEPHIVADRIRSVRQSPDDDLILQDKQAQLRRAKQAIRFAELTKNGALKEAFSAIGIWINPSDATRKIQLLRNQGRLEPAQQTLGSVVEAYCALESALITQEILLSNRLRTPIPTVLLTDLNDLIETIYDSERTRTDLTTAIGYFRESWMRYFEQIAQTASRTGYEALSERNPEQPGAIVSFQHEISSILLQAITATRPDQQPQIQLDFPIIPWSREYAHELN